MLAEEFGTASNIKSRVNRLSVLSAITSTQQRLKLYNKVPPNGLVVYCGEIITSEGKERKINIDFEPFKPINTSLYLCDNKFHTEALSELLESDQKFGFIIMVCVFQVIISFYVCTVMLTAMLHRTVMALYSAHFQEIPAT